MSERFRPKRGPIKAKQRIALRKARQRAARLARKGEYEFKVLEGSEVIGAFGEIDRVMKELLEMKAQVRGP